METRTMAIIGIALGSAAFAIAVAAYTGLLPADNLRAQSSGLYAIETVVAGATPTATPHAEDGSMELSTNVETQASFNLTVSRNTTTEHCSKFWLHYYEHNEVDDYEARRCFIDVIWRTQGYAMSTAIAEGWIRDHRLEHNR